MFDIFPGWVYELEKVCYGVLFRGDNSIRNSVRNRSINSLQRKQSQCFDNCWTSQCMLGRIAHLHGTRWPSSCRVHGAKASRQHQSAVQMFRRGSSRVWWNVDSRQMGLTNAAACGFLYRTEEPFLGLSLDPLSVLFPCNSLTWYYLSHL